MTLEIALRRMKRRRSKASPGSVASPRPMKACRWNGSLALIAGLCDSEELSVGTVRQPRNFWPSSAVTRSTIAS